MFKQRTKMMCKKTACKKTMAGKFLGLVLCKFSSIVNQTWNWHGYSSEANFHVFSATLVICLGNLHVMIKQERNECKKSWLKKNNVRQERITTMQQLFSYRDGFMVSVSEIDWKWLELGLVKQVQEVYSAWKALQAMPCFSYPRRKIQQQMKHVYFLDS